METEEDAFKVPLGHRIACEPWGGRLRVALETPAAVRQFLGSGALEFDTRCDAAPVPPPANLPRAIFELQTRREFCYLSKTQVQRYRAAAEAWIEQWVLRGEPVHYYLDIGGGYHASLRPGVDDLCFDVGLGEWLLLLQIHRFNQRVCRVYPHGVRFSLVIDNLCALLVNDIEVVSTSAYCAKLRDLIARLGLASMVDLFVESEQFTAGDFRRLQIGTRAARCPQEVTSKEHETVERFLGRGCDLAEVAERTARYWEITGISAGLIDSRIDGLHMTQRATTETICFRAYPGGASRIQNGQVALQIGAKGSVRPFLLTSHNEREYHWHRADCSDISPAGLDSVIHAVPLATPPSPAA